MPPSTRAYSCLRGCLLLQLGIRYAPSPSMSALEGPPLIVLCRGLTGCLEEESQLGHGLADADQSNLAGSGQQNIVPSA